MKQSFIVCLFIMLGLMLPAVAQKNKKTKEPTFTTTPSGLQYSIIKKGEGKKPLPGDKVTVHYTGKLTNDSVFDSSVKKNQPFSFKLGTGQVIKGWDEGVALLQVGDKAILRIPPALGYGSKDLGVIPPNSTLIFEVELLSIIEAPRAFDVQGKDTISTSTGLKYILIKENKDGVQAKVGDKVKAHYTGFLTNGKTFDSSVERDMPFEFKVGKARVIKGWDEAFLILKKGEKARLVVPHYLAYGEKGAAVIPPSSTLIFDVEVLDITPRVVPPQFDVKGKDTVSTASGLKYIVAHQSNSPLKAGSGKQVVVQYSGYLADGTLFDSSVENGQPAQFELGKNMVFPGFEEGLSLMSSGDKYRFIIPYQLAYGEEGIPPVIPAKATLIFDVEILLVTDSPKEPVQGGHDHNHDDPNHKH